MKIVLISPKGPLYRYRQGIFRKSLRYMPLTLPTLAALVPEDLNAEVVCLDEGIQDVDLALRADLIGMTVITGTAPRAYELAAHFRKRGIPVVLGGPHVTLVPEDAAAHADAIVTGYAEESWPQLLRDFKAGHLQKRYNQRPDLNLSGFPLPDRRVLPKSAYLTANVFEATRACIHNCHFCVVPSAWGRKPLQKPVEAVVADIRSTGARRAIFVDLNLISDRDYAASLFDALIPLKIQWYGLSTTLLCRDSELLALTARSGCRGLLMGFESLSAPALRSSGKAFNRPDDYAEVVSALHRHRIALQACFVFGLDDDQPDVFTDRPTNHKTRHRFAPVRHLDPFSRYAALPPIGTTGPNPAPRLEPIRRPARRVPTHANVDCPIAARHRIGLENGLFPTQYVPTPAQNRRTATHRAGDQPGLSLLRPPFGPLLYV